MSGRDRSASPQTRMLLESEGSSALLLQAWLDTTLRTRVDEVCDQRGRNVSAIARRVLQVADDSHVLLRRSSLVTATGMEVSRSHVVVNDSIADGLRHASRLALPIDWAIGRVRGPVATLLLRAGMSSWLSEGRYVPCAYKSYVIMQGSKPAVHVWERFNPYLIPAAFRGDGSSNDEECSARS